ncbi:MAG: hypothetical protein QHH14_07995 [Clostridiales bacterium]|nr:hypothetical protein [Clostridiales bacterium]
MIIPQEWLAYYLATLFLYFFPGWALLSLLWKGKPLRLEEKACLGAGVSVALYPILFLLASVCGISAGKWLAWLPGSLAIVVAVGQNITKLGFHRTRLPSHGSPEKFALRLDSWLFLALAVALFLIRWAAVRSMSAPAWGDSVHHTAIVRLIVENGGLFDSWTPYFPLQSMTYHFGFHANVAVFAWITGLAAPQAVLIAGQALNVLAVLVLYPLAVRLGGTRWAGLGAVMVAGLVSEMPGFYVNWGRYSQLSAQIILPAAVWFFDALWRDEERLSKGQLALVSILLAGSILSHYRVTMVLVAAALSWMLRSLWLYRRRFREWAFRLRDFALAGAASLFLASPWLVKLLRSRVTQHVGRIVRMTRDLSITEDLWVWENLSLYVSSFFWIAGIVALILAFWKKRSLAMAIGAWAAAAFLLANPFYLGIPGAGLVTNFVLAIGLYVPVSLLLGWVVGAVWEKWHESLAGRGAVVLSLSLCLAIAGPKQAQIVRPFFQLVTLDDLAAFEWIKAHVPRDARFLTNAFLAFRSRVPVGSDAGWWLSFYTERQGILLPAIFSFENVSPSIDQSRVRQMILDLRASEGDQALIREILCREGITHVFVGGRRGRAAYDAGELLPQAWLKTNADFTLLFRKGRAQVWRFTCSHPAS